MRLPQFVYLAGPDLTAISLAGRLRSPTRIEIDLNEAPEEFRLLFAPHWDIDRTIKALYTLDRFAIGNAGLKLFDTRTDHDPEAEAVIYPVRQPGDITPFTREPLYAHSEHLLIRIGNTFSDPPPATVRILSIPDFDDPDAVYAALQSEFAASMRSIERTVDDAEFGMKP